MTETGALEAPDHGSRGRGFARFVWRALVIAAFVVIALLATNAPASADDCTPEDADCSETNPTDDPTTDEADDTTTDEADGQDGVSDDRRGPLGVVEDVVRPTVERVLQGPDEATVDTPATTEPSETTSQARATVDESQAPSTTEATPTVDESQAPSTETRPIVDENHTPSAESGTATPAPAGRTQPRAGNEPVASTTVDLVAGLTRDLVPATTGVAARVDETLNLIDKQHAPSNDGATTAGEPGLSALTKTLDAVLPVLSLDRLTDPIVGELDGALTQPLRPVTKLLDPIVVPALGKPIEQTGAAINPAGHRTSDRWPTPVEAGAPTATETESTTASAVADAAPSRFLEVPVDTASIRRSSAAGEVWPDRPVGTVQVDGDVTLPASDSTVPAPGQPDTGNPGLDTGDGPGVHGVGSAGGGSSADSGKVVMDALKLPGNSSPIGDVVDGWQLPRSYGSEPGHSPD